MFESLANKEIAARIGVSESSVKATLQQLFSKTGVRTPVPLSAERLRVTLTPPVWRMSCRQIQQPSNSHPPR